MESLKLEAFGWLEIEYVSRDGEPVKKRVDLFTFYNQAVAVAADAVGRSAWNEVHRLRAEFFNAELGTEMLPTDASRLFDLLHQRVVDLKKKDLSNGSAGAPSSTGSRSGSGTTPRD